MLIIGHRGAPAYEPENTLRGFARALELGVDMLEFDVAALPSGEVLVFHDRTLDRTTNGSGLLLNQSFRELRRLDAGQGERIPTLEEVLDLIDRRVPVVIELKSPATAKAVAAVIERYVAERGWSHDQFIISSFHHPELYAFKTEHAPHIQVAASTYIIPLDGAAYAEALEAFAIVPSIDFIDQEFVDDAHRRGLKVYAYTIETYDHAVEMLELGVDGIFTDAPDVSRLAIGAGNTAGTL